MYLNEAYSCAWVGKHLSDTVPVKNGLRQGDASSSLLFNFAVDYAIRTVQVNDDGLKFKLHISFQFMLMILIYRADR
jgi:hypothetical protein